jgi:hypothetical protein
VRIPVANRAIIDVYESFFAVSFNLRPQSQGYIAQAMAPTAFGGSNYSNSFSGGIGTVHEPGGGGTVDFGRLFEQYAKGQTLARAFKNSAGVDRYLKSMVVGDPLMTIRDSSTLITPQDPPADILAPVIQSSSPDGTLPANTTSKILSVTTNESATCKYNTTGNLAFSSSNNTPFTTTGGTTHSTTLTNLSSGTSYKYYIRCQDAASNRNTSDYQVLFAVAALAPEVDTVAPNVSISYPTTQTVVTEEVVTVTASASDLVGVSGVIFYLDGHASPEDTTVPYSRNVLVSPGTHSVYAVARDAAGNRATSASVTFTVRAPEQIVEPTPPPVVPPVVPALSPEQTTYVRSVRETYTPQDTTRTNTTPEVIRLTKQLKLNDQDAEIALLQKTLNLLGYTIAETGPGSPGNETVKFGEQTRDALMRYQRSYADSGVLATGVLDNATIVLLNKDIDRLIAKADAYETEALKSEDSDGGFISAITSFVGSVFGGIADFIRGIFE